MCQDRSYFNFENRKLSKKKPQKSYMEMWWYIHLICYGVKKDLNLSETNGALDVAS